MITLAGQGVVPGLVLCQGEEGHVAVETAFDQCCAASLEASLDGHAAHLPDTAGLMAPDGCGPCSDTPILVNPPHLPSYGSNGVLNPVQNAEIIKLDLTDNAENSVFYSLSLPINELIPIKTSVLLN